MSDETTNDVKCPDCGVPCIADHRRYPVDISRFNGAAAGDGEKMLLRLPVMRCPVCQEAIWTEATQAEMVRSITEHVDRQIRPAAEMNQRCLVIARRSVDVAWFVNGAVFMLLAICGCAVTSIPSRVGVIGVPICIASFWWLQWSFTGWTPIDRATTWFAKRRISKIQSRTRA